MASQDPIRYDGRTVGELTNGGKTFIWFQNPLHMYGDNGGFSISESLLGEIPFDCETFVVKSDDDGECYVFERRQFETGEKVPIHDDRFNETPPEPQYVVPKGEARKTFPAAELEQ